MNFVVFNLDNLEACRLIRRCLMSSVHQDTIVEEAADQARDHGHDVIATWLEVCCCWGGVQTCLSLMFHSACSRLSASLLCISLVMPATSRSVLLFPIVELLHTCAIDMLAVGSENSAY